MKLFCILVGAKGSAFSVNIEESDTVGDLKDAIKKEKANDLKTVDADRLHLYLAKRDNKWLPSQDPIVVALKKGEISEGITALMTEELDPTFSIGDLKAKSNLPDPSTQQIHVLVDLRDQRDEMASAGIPVRVQDNGGLVARVPPESDFFGRVTFGWRAGRFHPRGTSGENRPDYLFVVDSVCVFRGEEEAPGARIATARRELCEKIIWRYGKVPYLFGYAAVGFQVNLYAIVRSSASRQVDAVELGSFYLHNLEGRFRLLLALLNISRLLWSIASLCPESGQDEYKRLVQSNGVQVHLEPICVVKIFPDAATFQNAKWHLERAYAILQDNQVPYVDILIDTDEPTRRMVFIPRGTDTKPSSIEDLFHVLRDVLSALVKLHEAVWMHRDIRWLNVMKTRDGSGSWFLIDFVDAAQSPQDAPSSRHLSQEEHAPEIHSDDQHTTAVDMWSVGHLIETSGVRVYESWYDLYGERTEFVQQLMHDDPSQRPTAAAALEQLMQLEQQYIEQKQRESSTNDSGAPTKKLKT